QDVGDVQRLPADLGEAGELEVAPGDDDGRHRGEDEPEHVLARAGVTRQPPPQQHVAPVHQRRRFSRTRTLISTGVPAKPKVSRSRRSMNRRYPCSMNPVAKRTKRGGRVSAWVAKRMRGCLPPRTGCGCAAVSSPRKALSRPVEMRVSQPSSAVSSALTSRSTCQRVLAETLTRGAHCSCPRSLSIDRSSWNRLSSSMRSHLL